MEKIVVHFMFGDNLEWRSTFAVLCLLIELVTVATALYIFWSAGCFVGKTVKLYHPRRSMINIKNSDQENRFKCDSEKKMYKFK